MLIPSLAAARGLPKAELHQLRLMYLASAALKFCSSAAALYASQIFSLLWFLVLLC